MGGDTGQLQRLTDQQVNARLDAYNAEGSLDRDIALLNEKAGDLLEAACAGTVDASWIQAVAEIGRRLYTDKASVPHFIAERDQQKARTIAGLFERFARDAPTLQACVEAFQRVTTIETDIILAQVALLEAIDAADQRGRESEQFERSVAELVRSSTDQSKSLTDRTRATAASARGMLGKTSEVAAAAEQSAVAMREAAAGVTGAGRLDGGV